MWETIYFLQQLAEDLQFWFWYRNLAFNQDCGFMRHFECLHPGMSLTAGCWLISQALKKTIPLTQIPLENRGKIWKVKLSEKAILTVRNACSAFPLLHHWLPILLIGIWQSTSSMLLSKGIFKPRAAIYLCFSFLDRGWSVQTVIHISFSWSAEWCMLLCFLLSILLLREPGKARRIRS